MTCRIAIMTSLCCIVAAVASAHGQQPSPARQVYEDVPFRQVRAIRYRNEIDLAGRTLRTVRVDRDGRALVNTERGLLTAYHGRLVPYRGYAGLEGLDHLDLELLDGRFVFLTSKMLLPLDRAGADYLDNTKHNCTRVAALARSNYLLLSADAVYRFNGGDVETRPNPGYREVVLDPHSGGAILFGPDMLACFDGDTLHALPAPAAEICGAIAVAPGHYKVATADGLFAVVDETIEPDPTLLPNRDLTCIDRDRAGRLWLGSARGAFCIEPDGRLRYYAGGRWLHDGRVIDLFVDTRNDVFILTTGGLSKLACDDMTLHDKAEHYLRNLRLNHIRYGLVSDVDLIDGDYAHGRLRDRDNDGLWSSIYLSAEAFRYAATQQDDALANFMDGFDAIERLVTITGIPGFQARTFELDGFQVTHPERWRTRAQRDFAWKGHTSSDEIVGTMFFYGVVDETVARTHPAVGERTADVVGAIVDHIIDHDLYLVDIDGKPTRWGRWNPEYVNTDAVGGDRRLNSVEILSFLQLAYALTEAPRYKDVFDELVNEHGYADNTVRYLPDPMSEWNHSDDELYWLSYYNLVRHCFDDALKPTFLQSAREHMQATARKKNPLWNIIYGHISGETIDLAAIAYVLREFPLDLRRWRMENSHRLDVDKSVRPQCEPESVELLSPAERHASKWNVNEMALDGGDDGNAAESGAEYLLPYWMGRYCGYITPAIRDENR